MYKLEIQGTEGVYNATLSHDGDFIGGYETSGIGSIKLIKRWAKSAAAQHKAAFRAARIENYVETFEL